MENPKGLPCQGVQDVSRSLRSRGESQGLETKAVRLTIARSPAPPEDVKFAGLGSPGRAPSSEARQGTQCRVPKDR